MGWQDSYPGANIAPTWWTTSATTTDVRILPGTVFGSGMEAAPPEPEPKTNIEWLRERVTELCELAVAA